MKIIVEYKDVLQAVADYLTERGTPTTPDKLKLVPGWTGGFSEQELDGVSFEREITLPP